MKNIFFILLSILVLISCTQSELSEDKKGYIFSNYKQIIKQKDSWPKDMVWAKFNLHIDGDITAKQLKYLHENDIAPYINLIPYSRYDKSINVNEIADGIFDELLKNLGKEFKKTLYPIYVQFPTKQMLGISIKDYLDFYHYIADLFKLSGAHNIIWVFEADLAKSTSKNVSNLFPGTDYVDLVLCSEKDFDIVKNAYPKYKIIIKDNGVLSLSNIYK